MPPPLGPTRLAAACAAACLVLASPLSAATFNVFDLNDDTLLGTFDAAPEGGQVSSAAFLIGGATFDKIDPTDIPEFRPAFNDLIGPGGDIFANFTNTVAAGGCAASGCFLFFEKIDENTDARVYGAFNGETFENLGGGFYRIAPVPLPGAGVLLLGALAGAAALHRRRNRPVHA